jgi:hypothetical protein
MNIYQSSARLAALLLPLSALAQGPLPPPGAPGPTMKTLDQLDAKLEKRIPISSIPFDITKPGSYYLTQNVSGAAPGIVAKVSGVTIDLNGFTITGPGKGLTGTGSGIVGLEDTVVRNGRISDFGDDGVHLGGAGVLENLDIVNIGGACITAGEQSRVLHCRVGNGNLGIALGPSSLVDACTSIGNTGASPAAGIILGSYGTVSNSISSYNVGDGISVANSDAVTNCVVANNTGGGIVAAAGSKVNESTSRSNKGTGISVGSSSTVKRCTVTDSGNDGIRAANSCVILENNVAGNALIANNAGIHLTGTNSGAANRLESNEVILANPGIQVDSSGNLIIKNTVASGFFVTSPYRIANGNNLRVVAAPTSGPFDGNSGGNGLGSTDPWANFTY